MVTRLQANSLLILLLVTLVAAGCGATGQVDQGRVIAYDRQTQRATVIREADQKASYGILPPVVVRAPENPEEMGPVPSPGKLIQLDTKARHIVIYDAAVQEFRTIPYTVVSERRNIAKSPAAPVIDRVAKTITIYSAAEKTLITFAASDDLLALPADTWRPGDVVRYYYKEPGQALRMMNVTKTDLSKSGG
ncbi:MAG TPA: DUF4881 domain-containing protein [Bryobacteraceae bacterium]|nr:DUF4881 domain-containing protein [Bryobacteraceae bacterium]